MSDREELKAKLRENFAGKIVRKDLTKKIGYSNYSCHLKGLVCVHHKPQQL